MAAAATNLCVNHMGPIICTELVGPEQAGSKKVARYLRLTHDGCGMNVLRQQSLLERNAPLMPYVSKDAKELVLMEATPQDSEWTHAQICAHPKLKMEDVKVALLEKQENSRRHALNKAATEAYELALKLQADSLEKDGAKSEKGSTKTQELVNFVLLPMIDPKIPYEMHLFSCEDCGMNCYRARAPGTWYSTPNWQALQQLGLNN